MSLRLLVDNDPGWFPDPNGALAEPNGLLAVGGDLSVQRLVSAYRQGIFPWFNPGEPLLWWSPDPRMVLRPEALHISRSLKKTLQKNRYHTTFDRAFSDVMRLCGEPYPGRDSSWIGPEMLTAYTRLHKSGIAHSVETWDRDDQLCGGLYGVLIGAAFFGESMFSRRSDASKIALVGLCQRLQAIGVRVLDCQMVTPHLASMGSTPISRAQFLRDITGLVNTTTQPFTDRSAIEQS